MTVWKRCQKKTNDNMRDKKIIMWNFWDKKKNLDKKNCRQEKILANCKAFFLKQKTWFWTNYFNNHTIDCNQHCNNGVIL